MYKQQNNESPQFHSLFTADTPGRSISQFQFQTSSASELSLSAAAEAILKWGAGLT